MRLVDTVELKLCDFLPDRIPEYAILSHTWEEDQEVGFAEFGTAKALSKNGWQKIKTCCETALNDSYRFVWIDCCCIDKSSSAELSEAINSMYSWYAKASICYAVLSDFSLGSTIDTESLSLHQTAQAKIEVLAESSGFRNSRWFTRGWTLQELLASRNLHLYDRNWIELGTKRTASTVLSEITGIDEDLLLERDTVHSASISKRMSWASKRKTTRPEDIAYCLMGIFDVNMPLLYGEGAEKAFVRLQEEIMKSSDDQSLFAWTDPAAPYYKATSLLANRPECFSGCGNFEPVKGFGDGFEHSSTNKGISADFFMDPHNGFKSSWVAFLRCAESRSPNKFAMITLLDEDNNGTRFLRINSGQIGRGALHGVPRRIFVGNIAKDSSRAVTILPANFRLCLATPLKDVRVSLVARLLTRRLLRSKILSSTDTKDDSASTQIYWIRNNTSDGKFVMPWKPDSGVLNLEVSFAKHYIMLRIRKNSQNVLQCDAIHGRESDWLSSWRNLGSFNPANAQCKITEDTLIITLEVLQTGQSVGYWSGGDHEICVALDAKPRDRSKWASWRK